MNSQRCRQSPLWVLIVACAALVPAGCRQPAPVIQHFLRIPAESAGGLSAIHRAQWLKAAKRTLPGRKELTATGHLVLPGTATKHGTVLRGMEMLFIPGAGRAGGIAVITHPGDKQATLPELSLLACDRQTYVDASAIVPQERLYWQLSPTAQSITGCAVSIPAGGGTILSPRRKITWNGQSWQAR